MPRDRSDRALPSPLIIIIIIIAAAAAATDACVALSLLHEQCTLGPGPWTPLHEQRLVRLHDAHDPPDMRMSMGMCM